MVADPAELHAYHLELTMSLIACLRMAGPGGGAQLPELHAYLLSCP